MPGHAVKLPLAAATWYASVIDFLGTMDSVVVHPSDIEGLGAFARRPFKRNDVILAIDDSRVVGRDTPLTGDEQERHCDYLEAGKVVLMQPPERYINHSCDPNTYVKTVNGRRFVIARREIQSREEITYDYSVNGGGDTVWLCRCGALRCRRDVHSDFFHLPIELQREYLPELDDWFVKERRDDVTHLRQQLSII
jgi:hypothetical protein